MFFTSFFQNRLRRAPSTVPAREDALFQRFVFKYAAGAFNRFGRADVCIVASDEYLLQIHDVCDRQRERKLHFGVILAAFAGHDALCTPIRKIRFILRFRDLLGQNELY